MKVGIVCPYDLGRPGGVQDQVVRLRRWLTELGHDVVLVGPGEAGPDGAVLLGRSRVLKANQSSAPISLDPRVGRQLAEALEDVDVMHIHEPLMPVVGVSATRNIDVAKVGTFHADPPRWVRRGYRGTRRFARTMINHLHVTTATSTVSASAVAPFADPVIVPNGVDVADYTHGPKTPGRVAFLGRDDQRKGLDVLLDAWPAIVDAVPEATLSVIGAERTNDDPTVRFLGWVSEEVKQRELALAEVYCAPNLGGESFGIVLVEAMASGCAIVASAIPAFAHVTGGSAVLVAPGDALGLGEAVIGLLSDDQARAALQARAQRRVEAFDGPAVASRFVSLYEEAVTSHQGLT